MKFDLKVDSLNQQPTSRCDQNRWRCKCLNVELFGRPPNTPWKLRDVDKVSMLIFRVYHQWFWTLVSPVKKRHGLRSRFKSPGDVSWLWMCRHEGDSSLWTYSQNKIDIAYLGGGFIFFNVHPYLGKWFPFWQAHFSDGLVQPPTRYQLVTVSRIHHTKPIQKAKRLWWNHMTNGGHPGFPGNFAACSST